MVIYVDIDETICRSPKNLDYNLSEPYPDRIEKINKLFDKGHKIVYWTARGRLSKTNWYDVTKKQLESWGAKYTSLDTHTKPAYDLLICDKAITHISEIDLEKFVKSH